MSAEPVAVRRASFDAVRRELECDRPSCRCHKPVKGGREVVTHCPVHLDLKDPSLSLLDNGDQIVPHCFTGCDHLLIKAEMRDRGLPLQDGWIRPRIVPLRRSQGSPSPFRRVAEYHYGPDVRHLRLVNPETGEKRCPWQRRVNGRWEDHSGGLAAVGLYREDDLPRPSSVLVLVEGEPCVELARSWGFHATSGPGGADTWRERDMRAVEPYFLVILPDDDEAGERHAQRVLANHPVGRAVILRLPGLSACKEHGADLVDWAVAGHTREELLGLVLALDGVTACAECGRPIASGRRGFKPTVCGNACRLRRSRAKVVSPNSASAPKVVSPSSTTACQKKVVSSGPKVVSPNSNGVAGKSCRRVRESQGATEGADPVGDLPVGALAVGWALHVLDGAVVSPDPVPGREVQPLAQNRPAADHRKVCPAGHTCSLGASHAIGRPFCCGYPLENRP